MLYHISAYSHRKNEWVRYMVTADNVEKARTKVEEYLDDTDYKVRHVRQVCRTTDDVFTEV